MVKTMGETKWDILYDPKKKSLFSRIEEFAINTYFSDVFVKEGESVPAGAPLVLIC
mgnify:CR=1 FL=1